MSSTPVAAIPNTGLGSSSWEGFCSGLGRWAAQDKVFPGPWLGWGARAARRALPTEGQGLGQSQRRARRGAARRLGGCT